MGDWGDGEGGGRIGGGWGSRGIGLGTDHVISGPMRDLKKHMGN